MYFLYIFIILCSVTQETFCSEDSSVENLSAGLVALRVATGQIIEYNSSDEEELVEEDLKKCKERQKTYLKGMQRRQEAKRSKPEAASTPSTKKTKTDKPSRKRKHSA